MSVSDTVKGAKLLFESGLKEQCFRELLVSIAATSRKRYPHPTCGDKAAFETFILDEIVDGNFFGPRFRAGLSLVWNGAETPIETILYELRCSLVHEDKMHEGIRHDPRQDPTHLVIRIDEDGKFVFQDALLDCMLKCVHNVPENESELSPIPFTERPGGGSLETSDRKNRLVVIRCARLPLP